MGNGNYVILYCLVIINMFLLVGLEGCPCKNGRNRQITVLIIVKFITYYSNNIKYVSNEKNIFFIFNQSIQFL
jgi:hypothetical protein